MNSVSIGISIDIIDYYPKDFDYMAYTFIFISEENNFEREISFINSNQICHKILYTNKKDIKYAQRGTFSFVLSEKSVNFARFL